MPSLSIALSSAQRQSLVSLQQTDALSQETQQRLATGRKINSVVDDTVSYFRAKSLTDRAADFNMRKTLIDQGVSTLETALEGISTLG
ncbi:MAG: hypothetical protein R3261_13725 [Alphaproteobacteria bacterium]|nr:hypothetical protein [Alphaproteobacteria bacterium]